MLTKHRRKAQHRRNAQDPTPDKRVESLLAAAAAPTEPGPVPGEAAALTAFRAETSPTPLRRPRMLTSFTPLRAAAAAVGTGVLLTGGMAAAATGSLPGAAQETASEMLARVGVTVPGVPEHAAEYADQRGGADDTTGGSSDPADGAGESSKGAEISELATETDSTGADKGAEISESASDGRSKAGEQGTAGAENGADDAPGAAVSEDASGAARENARVEVPNRGGAARTDGARSEQGSGASTSGTDTADESSGGRSSADSGNRP